MRRAVILVSLVAAVFSMQACATSRSRTATDDSVLNGVRTVYVEPSLQFYVRRALAKELPGVHVVADAKAADVTLDFNFTMGASLPAGSSTQTYETPSSYSNGVATYQTHSVTVPIGEASYGRGYSTAIARRPDGRSTVVYQGFSGEWFTSEFVVYFIKAWRAANPGTT